MKAVTLEDHVSFDDKGCLIVHDPDKILPFDVRYRKPGKGLLTQRYISENHESLYEFKKLVHLTSSEYEVVERSTVFVSPSPDAGM